MSDMQSNNIPHEVILAEISFVPIDDEDEDFETVSTLEDVTANVLIATRTMQGYTSKMKSDTRRSAGVILLLGILTHQVISQKDLIIAFLQAGKAAIGAMAKQKHISKIEVSLDGDSISIETPDIVTVQRLLDLFQAKHPDLASKVTASSKLQVTGKVSKTALLAEK